MNRTKTYIWLRPLDKCLPLILSFKGSSLYGASHVLCQPILGSLFREYRGHRIALSIPRHPIKPSKNDPFVRFLSARENWIPPKPSRGDRIRTCDLVLPKHPRYQAAPRPVQSDNKHLKSFFSIRKENKTRNASI